MYSSELIELSSTNIVSSAVYVFSCGNTEPKISIEREKESNLEMIELSSISKVSLV